MSTHRLTRWGFLHGAALAASGLALPLQGSCAARRDRGTQAGMGEPRIEHRNQLHYVAVRTRVSMKELGPAIERGIGEVFGWLKVANIKPSGPPLVRYLVIDMPSGLDVEIGVPVGASVHGSGRIRPGALPAGQYAVLTFTGDPSRLVGTHAALQDWASKRGIRWAAHTTKHGEVWRARVEFYLTDPDEEPDRRKWRTEVAYLVSEEHKGHGSAPEG